jgi:hypothetical protein
MKYKNYLFSITLVIILIPINIPTIAYSGFMNKTISSEKKTILQINDFAEYSIEDLFSYQAIDENGFISGPPMFFNSVKIGYLKWSVINKTDFDFTLKIEISIENFFSIEKNIILSNGTAYTEQYNELGYIPFWIPLDTIKADPLLNISLDGYINNHYVGKLTDITHRFFLGGDRNVLQFTNLNYFYFPGQLTGNLTGGFKWYFSEHNGILVEMHQTQIWRTLQLKYQFQGNFVLTKTNIDFGSSDAFYTLLYYLAPLWFFFIIPPIGFVFILSFKFKKWKKKRNDNKK